MHRFLTSNWFGLVFLFLLGAQSVFSQCGIEKPKVDTSVYDLASFLSAAEQKALERKLVAYSDQTSTQIVFLSVSSLNGGDIAQCATEIAHEWGIGQQGKDNGVLILLARAERKVNIATGYGVEHLLTDALSKRIINNILVPSFKEGQFFNGLDRASDAIFQILKGTYKNSEKKSKKKSKRAGKIGFFVVLAIVLFFLIGRKGGGGPGRRRGGFSGSDLLTAVLLSNLGRSSGSFGGSGFGSGGSGFGGGFSGGFGGGGFGGGGASGSW